MARGKKIVSVEERIAAAEAQITSLQEEIKAKKEELKELQKEKDAADQKKVMDAIQTSGKSLDDVLAFINSDD